MGGLAGIVDWSGTAPDRDVLAAMSARLAHRGPDGEGSFAEGPIGLAHRRRAVVASRSIQPVVDTRYVVAMDGWIYDHADVARLAGHTGELSSDTVALLAAWKRWGLALTQRIDGAFAAAIWDRAEQTLHLIRDRAGIRPLFWWRQGPRLAFASELPALLQTPWIERSVATENLSEYLSFRVVHAPRTLIREVHQLEAAHWLRAGASDTETRRYWALRYAAQGTPHPPEGEVVRSLQEAMDRAVKRRLGDGAPAALYLSGGLGSTAIAASARSLNRSLPSWTVSFTDDPHPESPFAGRVAALLGLEHHEEKVGTAELAGAFDATVTALGQPIGAPAAVLQLLLARVVGQHARVVLSGDGGEELFGGRMLDGVARDLRLAGLVEHLPRAARGLIRRTGARGRRLATPTGTWGLDLEIGGADLFDDAERGALLRDPELVEPHVRHRVLEPFYARVTTDPINAILHAWLRSALSEESLARADRTAAAAGLDIRFPLLDRQVLTMAAALPGSVKVRRAGGSLHTRWPLRAMLRGVIPPTLVNRPKRGLPAPLDRWLAGPGRLFLEDRVAALREDPHGLFRPEAIEGLRREIATRRGAGLRLWTLFLFDAWLRTL